MKGCRPLTDAEVQSILHFLETTRNPTRDKALFLLGLRSGFRISELLSLTVQDVCPDGHFVDRLYIARRHMKKKMEGRSVALHPEAKAALREWVTELQAHSGPEVFVFSNRRGGRMHRIAAWRMLKRAYRACGLTGKLGTHTMRKTFAKRVHEKLGRDLVKTQKALGHKSVSSTVSYLSVDEEEIDEAILKS